MVDIKTRDISSKSSESDKGRINTLIKCCTEKKEKIHYWKCKYGATRDELNDQAEFIIKMTEDIDYLINKGSIG